MSQSECSRILRERSSASCRSSPCSSSSSSFAVLEPCQHPSARQIACATAPPFPAEPPLPGVCYITYPATPDLASSSCPSLQAPEGFAVGDDDANGDSRRGRLSRSSPSGNSSRSRSRSLSRGSSSGGGGDGGRSKGGDGRSRSAQGHRRVSGGNDDRPKLLRRRPSCPFIEGGTDGQSRDESQRPNCPFIGGTGGQSLGDNLGATGSDLSSKSMGGGSSGGGIGGDGGGGGGSRGGSATTGTGNQEQERPEEEKEGGRDGSRLSQRGLGLQENLPEGRPGEQRAAEEGPSFEAVTSAGRESIQQDEMESCPPRLSGPKRESAPATKAERRRGRGKGWGRGSGTERWGDATDAHPLEMEVLPSLPGVDEHQLPSFCLAELHGDIRRNRCGRWRGSG